MKSAKQNNAEACHWLGSLYLNGDGVKKDYDEAFKWHMKSAKLGFVGAQLHLGIYYYCCLLYTSPSPRDATLSRMPSSA